MGLVGLVVDRTFLRPQGGPKAASAGISASDTAVHSGSTPEDENPPARAPVAERLNRLLPDRGDGAVEFRDPFSLPAAWSEGGSTSKERTPPDGGDLFARRHVLKAVVVQGEEACVQVDDSFLVPGQSLDGFKLVLIGLRSAVFERAGKQVVLELALQ